MRYFRDLGADAHLLLFTNDGVGSLSHFRPDDDTFSIERWQPYIHRTKIPNDPIASSGGLAFWLYDQYLRLRLKRAGTPHILPFVRTKEVQNTFRSYDRVVGSGIAPAVFARIKQPLDIFFPYALGVEWYDCYEYQDYLKRPWYGKWIAAPAREMQAQGIKSTRHILNAETGITETVLKKMGVDPKRLAIPMVYNGEPIPTDSPLPILAELKRWLAGKDLSLFTSARLMWTDTGIEGDISRKNNHLTLLALQKLKQEFPQKKLGMVAVEYGPDVDATRKLVGELGLADEMFWLAKSSRAVLMQALSLCDVAVGEFYFIPGTIWGGTGWEALAMGKPLLQGFNFSVGEYEDKFGYPIPPALLPVAVADDIFPHLRTMLLDPAKRKKMGLAGKEWFDKYNGISLAKEWLKLLLEPNLS
jgi:glycosyltransferase involved in cell wall biosynthesis